MISLMMRKVCILSMICLFSATQVFADSTKIQKTKSCVKDTFTASCEVGFRKSIECLEKSACDKIRKLRCALFEEFSEQNELFYHKIELLNLRLKEFVATKKRASNLLLKDFVVCRLHATEENLEEFIAKEFECLKEFLCQNFQEIQCDLNTITCGIVDVEGTVDCMLNTMFIPYLNVVYGAPDNPFFLNPDLLSIINAAEECANLIPCSFVK